MTDPSILDLYSPLCGKRTSYPTLWRLSFCPPSPLRFFPPMVLTHPHLRPLHGADARLFWYGIERSRPRHPCTIRTQSTEWRTSSPGWPRLRRTQASESNLLGLLDYRQAANLGEHPVMSSSAGDSTPTLGPLYGRGSRHRSWKWNHLHGHWWEIDATTYHHRRSQIHISSG